MLLGWESVGLLIAGGFLVGIGEVLVDTALQSVVPTLVGEDRLDAANARLGAAELIANQLAGPPLGACCSRSRVPFPSSPTP